MMARVPINKYLLTLCFISFFHDLYSTTLAVVTAKSWYEWSKLSQIT